jgi:microcystin-dependent protein
MIATADVGTASSPDSNILAQSANIKAYAEVNPTQGMAANMVGPQGGSQPHENCQPFLVINFIISLFGRFPTQT